VTKEVGRAIHQYEMIRDGDRVLVGLSGGKDSSSLVKILHERRARLPIDYELVAMHVTGIGPCMERVDLEGMSGYVEDLGLPLHHVRLDVDEPEPGKSRCWWCSWNRRKALFQACREHGCNRLALAHHQDDIVETLLINMFWHGEISTMPPVVEMFEGEVTLIRPLALVSESRMRRYARESEFPFELHTCALAGRTERGYVKQLLHEVSRESPKVRTNLFRAMSRLKERVKKDYLV